MAVIPLALGRGLLRACVIREHLALFVCVCMQSYGIVVATCVHLYRSITRQLQDVCLQSFEQQVVEAINCGRGIVVSVRAHAYPLCWIALIGILRIACLLRVTRYVSILLLATNSVEVVLPATSSVEAACYTLPRPAFLPRTDPIPRPVFLPHCD